MAALLAAPLLLALASRRWWHLLEAHQAPVYKTTSMAAAAAEAIAFLAVEVLPLAVKQVERLELVQPVAVAVAVAVQITGGPEEALADM